jgi:hypothetical protein
MPPRDREQLGAVVKEESVRFDDDDDQLIQYVNRGQAMLKFLERNWRKVGLRVRL